MGLILLQSIQYQYLMISYRIAFFCSPNKQTPMKRFWLSYMKYEIGFHDDTRAIEFVPNRHVQSICSVRMVSRAPKWPFACSTLLPIGFRSSKRGLLLSTVRRPIPSQKQGSHCGSMFLQPACICTSPPVGPVQHLSFALTWHLSPSTPAVISIVRDHCCLTVESLRRRLNNKYN